MMGHYVLPNPLNFHMDVDPSVQAPVQTFWKKLTRNFLTGIPVRILVALATQSVEWNKDDWSGT